MAMGRPIIMGVDGEARAIVRDSGCGVEMDPGDEKGLVNAVCKLADDPGFAATLASAGRPFVAANFTRDLLADRYLEILRAVAGHRPIHEFPQYVSQPATSKTSV